MGKKVLVTGGCGFIGSHVVEAYLKEGYEVVVVDNLSTGSLSNLSDVINNPALTVLNVDIRDEEKVHEVFAKYRPNVINHHAAQKSIPYSVENPRYEIEENMLGLVNLLMACKEYPVENFIFVSSGGALSKEIVNNEKSTEEDKPQQESPYAISKFAGENYVRIYSQLYGFNYVVLRYANVYGPRQIKEGECGVIPIFVDNILDNKPSVLMTYDDMPRGCTRDYVNVKDIAEINVLVSDKKLNEIFNVGSGEEIAILDIYEKVKEVFGSELPIEKRGPRLGDVRRSVLSNSKAEKYLGWKPSVDLETGLAVIREYIKKERGMK